MAEEPNVDANAPEGGTGTPNPAPSEGQEAPVAGQAASTPPEIVEAIRAVVREEFKPLRKEVSATYSRQDKQDNAFREFMAEYRKQQKKGLSDTEAEIAAQEVIDERTKTSKRDQIIDALADRFLNENTPQSPGTGAGGAVNAAQAFAEAGFDLKDPRVSKAMAKDYKDQDALDLATYRLRDQIQSGPGPTPAQGAAIQGKPPVAPDVAGLTQEYINEVAAARGNKSLIKGIQQKYQKLGVNVGNVDFRV